MEQHQPGRDSNAFRHRAECGGSLHDFPDRLTINPELSPRHTLTVACCPVGCELGGMTGLNLPQKCGVMLLPDCTLFPQGGLPLFIFEERYRLMLADALAGDCVFAVGRVRDDGENETISPVGTAGLIRASRERVDGTSELLLHGVIRVRFNEWLDDTPYPCALIEPLLSAPLEDRQAGAAMRALKGAVEDGIAHLPEEVRTGVMTLLDQADEPALMADVVAQQFVHEPDLRQKLLETISVGERISLLCGFFEGLKAGE